MIENDKEYTSARQALERVERSLIELHKDIYDKSPERYFIMAEPYLEYIKKLRIQVKMSILLKKLKRRLQNQRHLKKL